MRNLGVILAIVLSTACGNGSKQLLISMPDQPDVECENEVSDFNFIGAHVPTDDTPDTGTGNWTYEEDITYSPALTIAEILESKDGPLLVFGDSIFPGTKDGGKYTFTWEVFTDGDSSEAYLTDYKYGQEGHDGTKQTLVIDVGEGTGTWSIDVSSTMAYVETDEWDTFSGSSYSQIPVSNYLVDENDYYIQNSPYEADCSAAECKITVATHCTGDTSFSVTKVKNDDHAGATQPGGWDGSN